MVGSLRMRGLRTRQTVARSGEEVVAETAGASGQALADEELAKEIARLAEENAKLRESLGDVAKVRVGVSSCLAFLLEYSPRLFYFIFLPNYVINSVK